MALDLNTPQAKIARHFMHHKGYDQAPFDVLKLEDQACWYFYYELPEGNLELEVYFDLERDDWDVTVSAFPIAI